MAYVDFDTRTYSSHTRRRAELLSGAYNEGVDLGPRESHIRTVGAGLYVLTGKLQQALCDLLACPGIEPNDKEICRERIEATIAASQALGGIAMTYKE